MDAKGSLPTGEIWGRTIGVVSVEANEVVVTGATGGGSVWAGAGAAEGGGGVAATEVRG